LVTPDGVQAILKTPGTEAAGARHPDATVVEYFDYNCPYCKRLAPVLEKLLGTDPQVAVIYKEWPILGDVSVYAARSALAAQWQGKYLAAHTALLAAPRLSRNDQVDAILAAAGIRMDVLAKDRDTHAAQIDSLLARNDEEARALGLKGTPGVMAGRLLLTAEPTFATVKKLVADSRHGE
jgi:protein-disulfide isomerase